MKYLVTGGAGFIGSHLVDRLLTEGNQVVVVDDFSSGREENLVQHQHNKNLTIVRRSVNDDLTDLFNGQNINAVFHLAAIPSVQLSIKNPVHTHQVNVDGTVNLLQYSRDYGVKRFILASSAAVYGDQPILPHQEDLPVKPLSPYALHKLIGEQYLKLFNQLYGLETVILRCFNVFGPRQNPNSEYAGVICKFIDRLKINQPLTIYGDGEQSRDFVFIDDVVQAYLSAATQPTTNHLASPINIGGGRALTVNKLINVLQEVSGQKTEIKHGPAVVEVRHSIADITKAKNLLSWQPKVDFKGGLQKTYQYFT